MALESGQRRRIPVLSLFLTAGTIVDNVIGAPRSINHMITALDCVTPDVELTAGRAGEAGTQMQST